MFLLNRLRGVSMSTDIAEYFLIAIGVFMVVSVIVGQGLK